MAESIAELCQVFRMAKHSTGVALVAGRTEAIKLLAAFELCPLPSWRRPRSKMPEDGRERWLWLWSGFAGGPDEPEFLDALAQIAGISAEAAYRVWPSLMMSRVLYPDGTLSEDAMLLLAAHVESTLPRAPAKRGPKPKERT